MLLVVEAGLDDTFASRAGARSLTPVSPPLVYNTAYLRLLSTVY